MDFFIQGLAMATFFEEIKSPGSIVESPSRRRVLGMLGVAAASPLAPSFARAQSGKSVMRISHVLAEQDNVHRALLRFKDNVEKKSDGQLEVQIYANSTLGSLRVTFESMQLGNLEAGIWDAGTPSNVVPAWAIHE